MAEPESTKTKPRTLTFRKQLAIGFTLGILVLALATSLGVTNISNEMVRNQQIQQGLKIAESFAQQSKLALLYQSNELAKDVGDGIREFPGVIGIRITTIEGTVLYQSGEIDSSLKLFDETSEKKTQLVSLDSQDQWTFMAQSLSDDLQGDDWSEIYGEGEESQGALPLGFVTISIGQQALREMQSSILQSNLAISIIVGAVLLLLLIMLSRRITNPLERLSQVMKRAEGGDSQARAELRGPVDIVNMQHAFNTMMEVLEKREGQLMHARDAALESARVKGEFAANVTHELRTPMNAVLGMMELLMTMGLNAKQKEYVETAKQSGENLLELIDDILNFSEIEAQKIEIVPVDSYIHELLDDVVNLLSSSALKKKLDLGYIVAKDVPNVAYVDASRLSQVLINLVGNAIKFTSKGQVCIRVKMLVGDSGDQALCFEVVDTGIGISPENQQKIFEAFTQADSSTTKEYGGTGLGLSISRQIVELMGGNIDVTSDIGSGSVFWFSIPLMQSPTAVSLDEGEVIADQPLGDLRVLVVDDSAIVREFAQQQIEQMGFQVSCAETGLSALDLVRNSESHFDVILLDQEMPGLKGKDFLMLTRREESLSKALIALLVNPWSDVASDHDGIPQLPKPLLSDTLRDFFQNQLNGVPSKQSNIPQEDASPSQIFTSIKKVLVVDDNRPNQQVASGMLERLGCKVDVCFDGKQAIDEIVRHRYDAVLMDCHMPVMDGYEATRQIRMYEAGDEVLPIIAMTANTGQDEVRKCLDSGMTDFLSKPLRLEDLRKTLLKAIPEGQSSVEEVMTAHEPAAPLQFVEKSFDPQVLKNLRDSVGEVVSAMIEAFLEDTPVYVQSLRTALAEGDAKHVRELAHTIKGSAANFGADKVVRISKELEDMGANNALDEAGQQLNKLTEAYEALSKDLEGQLLGGASEHHHSEAYNLLIVDDDRSMRLALANVFDSETYAIEQASNGIHAISICKRHMPDLILMDAMMPEIDGFVACQRIRELQGGADVPILMITALDNEESIVEAFKSGATDYIPKPVHFAVMKQRVQRLVKASKVEKHVKKLAYHDPLTGLPNRAQLMQQLRVMLNRANLENEKVAILFLDLDRFKMINDTLGHDAGDVLLKAVADRIRRCVRDQDFIARLGGDEFTIVLEGVLSEEDVSRVALKICETLAQPFVFLQQKMFVTTSIGVSMFPEHGADTGSLLKHADSAMYTAKETRNGFCFYQEGMEDEIARRLELERELRIAIDDDQLVLHLQPQMDLNTGAIVGAEALVRWDHPKHGLLGPIEFIPMAEETGLINQIGNWVLEEACRLIRLWQGKGRLFKLAVNLSGRELLEVGLQKKITKLLNKYDIPADSLELEITESMIMENPEQNQQELLALKDMGVTVAIDDFGSGFSSLNYIKRLPVDVLKIDRNFIVDIETDPNDKAIVTGIVALAKSLGLTTVAEGVETEAQKQLLKELQCDTFQGYLLSRPVPADEFEKSFLHYSETETV
ncbi:MAG: EAL domain-containing protein [Pseudomonadales bacterium]|nr:EAL domain-containing protein [Pseudomonadales bacterium]MCP5171973.1 EAL domain-containing protein [Pseudomonadales bacterium]